MEINEVGDSLRVIGHSNYVTNCVPHPLSGSQMDIVPAPIAVQLYSLRDECAADFVGVLKRVAAMGYVGVELAGFNDLTPDELGRVLADTGLRLASAHQGLDPAEAFEPALDTYQKLGTDTVVVPAISPDDFVDANTVARAADRLNTANEKLKERSLTLGYHNHWWELQQSIDDRPALLALFDRLEPGIVAEVDIYWARVGGVDPAALLRELGDRVGLLHVKDGP
ncbi:MAG: sugar phosphate isomerase/epimerase family protein, partial [Myxococcota bacterium]